MRGSLEEPGQFKGISEAHESGMEITYRERREEEGNGYEDGR